MALKFAKGDAVQVAVKVVSGVIGARQFDEEDNIIYRLDWEEDGEPHSRWFTEEELEAVIE